MCDPLGAIADTFLPGRLPVLEIRAKRARCVKFPTTSQLSSGKIDRLHKKIEAGGTP